MMTGRISIMMAGCALAMAGLSSPARADTAAMAKLFGAREEVLHASLSPDGSAIALVQPLAGQASALYVADLAGSGELQPRRILTADGKPERLQWCRWVSNRRILCNVYAINLLPSGQISYVTRLLALDADGANMRLIQGNRSSGILVRDALYGGEVIDWAPGQDGHILMMRDYVPEESLGTRAAQTKDGLGVDDLDTMTLRSRTVERPRSNAGAYLSDGKGTVRIMGLRDMESDGYSSGVIRYMFRRSGSQTWEPLESWDDNRNGFDPHDVDAALDAVYGLRKVDGRLAAFRKALDGSGKEELIFAHPSVDVDGFVRIGRKGRVIGVSYATDRREIRYFDPDMEKLGRALSRALPGAPLIRFVDSTEDEKTLLLWAGGDSDPGRYYLLDRATNRMVDLAGDRPAINFPLAKVRALSYPAADGAMVPGYLTLPPGKETAKGLPAIIMPHGGPGARDEWGFGWLAQFFANQGYAVLQPNFRGSAGYGDAWFKTNGFQNWRTAIGDVNDGARWLVAQGIASADRMAIFGWSYGGYAALQAAVVEPDLFKAVIAVAPVTDLDRLREEFRYWSNFRQVSRFIGEGPHVEEGSPARHAASIKAPVLLFHGTLDRNVADGESQLMDSRLKKAGKKSELVLYPELDHYLDDSAARADMLTRSAAFLEQALAR